MQVRDPLPVALVNADRFDSWSAALTWYASWSGRPANAYAAPDATTAGHALGALRHLREELQTALRVNAAAAATTRELASLNQLLDAHFAARPTLVAANGRVGSARISTGAHGPALLLSEVALAIVELFASAKAARVKRCANDACAVFFFDESKSGTRTWCSMKTCGNRVKAARHYERTKN